MSGGDPDPVAPEPVSPDPTVDRDGDMGVSSERVGPTGPGQTARTGERDVTSAGPEAPSQTSSEVPVEEEPDPAEAELTSDPDVPAEQSAGGAETNPAGLPPKAGYPSADPRSAERPYEP